MVFEKNKNKKDYFLIKNKKNKIGVIRFEKNEFYFDISISILPKYQLLNLGSLALRNAENIIKKGKVISKIKKNNKNL